MASSLVKRLDKIIDADFVTFRERAAFVAARLSLQDLLEKTPE